MVFSRTTKKRKGLAHVVHAGIDFASKHLLYSTRSATPWYNHDTTSRKVEGLLLRTRGSQREETEYSRFLQRHSQ